MALLQTIIDLDAAYGPEGDVIDVIGTTREGIEVDLWIHNDADGNPALFPGASFLPYGGIYHTPIITTIREV